MIKYILDTDILSYLMKKNHQNHKPLLHKLYQEEEGSVAISVITLSEIAEGIENVTDNDTKKKLLSALEYISSSLVVLEFNDEAAWYYGKLRNYLRKNGNDIGAMDTLIAAHAASQNLILVTNNSKHFHRIPELKVEHWI